MIKDLIHPKYIAYLEHRTGDDLSLLFSHIAFYIPKKKAKHIKKNKTYKTFLRWKSLKLISFNVTSIEKLSRRTNTNMLPQEVETMKFRSLLLIKGKLKKGRS